MDNLIQDGATTTSFFIQHRKLAGWMLGLTSTPMEIGTTLANKSSPVSRLPLAVRCCHIRYSAGILSTDTYARFRLSSTGFLDPTGPAFDGEVEAYLAPIFADGTAQALKILRAFS